MSVNIEHVLPCINKVIIIIIIIMFKSAKIFRLYQKFISFYKVLY